MLCMGFLFDHDLIKCIPVLYIFTLSPETVFWAQHVLVENAVNAGTFPPKCLKCFQP